MSLRELSCRAELFPDLIAREKIENEDKKDEEKENHKEEMGIENERERTSSMLDCKHNVLHKPILLKMEKEIINL